MTACRRLRFCNRKVAPLALTLVTISILAACVADRGRLVTSPEIYRKFMSGEIREDYVYYFHGWRGQPDAVLGLKPGIKFESRQWTILENPETEVRPLIERFGRTSQNRFGYHVLDPEGNRIGVYFSEGGLVTIQMASETEIAWIKPTATSGENQRGR